MPRPVRCRKIGEMPQMTGFKPAGVPGRELEEIALTLDEFEAIRLADFAGLYQADAAQQMGVSRQTFGNILAEAHHKIAECLVEGKMLRIAGGVIAMDARQFECAACQHIWQAPCGTGRPAVCPTCQSSDVHRECVDAENAAEQPEPRRRRCCRSFHAKQNSGCHGMRGRKLGTAPDSETAT